MTPIDEALARVKAYVASWDGFDDGTIISDNCDPNDLILSDLRALLSALELGSVANEAELERHVAEALADHDGISLASEEAQEIYRSAAAVAIKTYRLRASTTDSGKVDHYRDDTALKFPTGEGGES